MIDKISNFADLHKFVENSDFGLRDAIIEYYAKLGDDMGFTARKNALVVKRGFNLGKLDLVWIETNTLFCVEFGSFDNIYRRLWQVLEYKPNLTVIILSSKSGCRPDRVKELVAKSPLISELFDVGKSFIILDVSSDAVVYP